MTRLTFFHSSCPMLPAPCNWAAQQNPGPNPHTLYGALVGGPGSNDHYRGDRTDDSDDDDVDDDDNDGDNGGGGDDGSVSDHDGANYGDDDVGK